MRIFYYILPIIIYAAVQNAVAQPYCYLPPLESSTSFAITNTTSTCISFANYATTPILTIYLNVHVFRDNDNPGTSDAVIVDRVRQLLHHANSSLDSLQANWQPGPNGVFPPVVPRAKWQYKLYSNLAEEPTDQYGGVWLYAPNPVILPSGGNLQGSNINQLNQIIPRYNNQVLDLILMDIDIVNGNLNNPFTGGYASLGVSSCSSKQEVVMGDVNKASLLDQSNANKDRLWFLSRSFNHEIGHTLNLRHSDDCNNFCKGRDLDVRRECGSACPAVDTCIQWNPIQCPSGVSLCPWSNSTNMMAQGWWEHTLTPCQWEQAMNFALSNPIDCRRLCTTVNTLTITNTLTDDYRAIQSITSTAVVNGVRKVDYQAPLIKLNSGFSVQKGTAFMAYPANFSCCQTGTQQAIEQPVLNGSTLHPSFKATPNPFKNTVTVEFSTRQTGTQDKLYMADLSGRVLQTVSLAGYTNGTHTLELTTTTLPPGIYFVHFQHEGRVITQKMVKMKE